MPGLEHPVSEMTKRTDADPYGCANAKRKGGYWSYQRQQFPDGNFMMTYLFIEDVLSQECRYDHSLTDPRCGTCHKRGSGEQYSEMIRRQGR